MAASITHGHLNGIERWPDEFGQLHRMGLENLRGIEQTIEEFGIDCDYRRAGELGVVTETYQIEHATDHVQRARAYGAELEWWDADRTQAEVHSPRIWAPSTTRTSVSSIPPVSVGGWPGSPRSSACVSTNTAAWRR